ncbi:hypothetical protein PNP85_04765 [Halobacterium salinarum]|uniref:DUF7979 domain-containing protein n=1 Tax=Halobacterium salinarum (strain ATCC 29341 / DSM 671 / R1) TaxID=478009 RepID=B0RA32_HALS3|nr:hypothetical protein [Halobacterium salinarum]MDL0132113.1 hypothetical protein [Halobacterium salinarum]MDL0138814.1 hypothetical protein [Halobacterium salinarum]CAP15633.1 uncharacterized protein OE_5322R [Halobacterium salinarum R1]
MAAITAVALLAGCTAAPTANSSTSPQTQTFSGVVLTVDKVVREDRLANASNASKTNFSALNSARQAEFQTALDHEVSNPDAWDAGNDIKYVRYNGTWYTIQTPIVN